MNKFPEKTRRVKNSELIETSGMYTIPYFTGIDTLKNKFIDPDKLRKEIPLAEKFLLTVPVVDFIISKDYKAMLVAPIVHHSQSYDYYYSDILTFFINQDCIFGKKGEVVGGNHKYITFDRLSNPEIRMNIETIHSRYFIANIENEKIIGLLKEEKLYNIETLDILANQLLPEEKTPKIVTDKASELIKKYAADRIYNFTRKVGFEDKELLPIKYKR
ncbi:hypothetical protein K9L97_03190 [Candidatus Woesearchaeota archaeon]|nr:hypothetical protein [Candidatus Woesearchaeota archaeon]